MSKFYDVLPGLIIFVISLILTITFSQLKRIDAKNSKTYETLMWLFFFILAVDVFFYFTIYFVS